MRTDLSFPANLPPGDPHRTTASARHTAVRTPQRPPDAALRGDGLVDRLDALLGRAARVLDAAALAPGDPSLGEVEQDGYDLIRGVNLEALLAACGTQATQLLGEFARKAGACLIEHGRAAEAGPVSLRDVFAFVRELTPHETRRLGAQWPASFASNRYWYLSGRIGAFDRFLTEPFAGARGIHDNTRRYFFGGGVAVKVHRYDHAHLGARNREQLDCEIAFLRNPPPGLAVPALLFSGETLREGWLARSSLDGELLLDLMTAGRPYDAATIVQDVLAQLVALERSGLYHGDVRCWNVIVGADGHASLIDYGSIGERPADSAWPWDVFLSFLIFAREVHGGAAAVWPQIRRPWFNPDGLPQARAFWAMLESPPETWSFARIQEDIGRTGATTVNGGFRRILGAIEAFDRESEDQRRKREAALEAALCETVAALTARMADVARLEAERIRLDAALTAARSRMAETDRALCAAAEREAALGRAIAAFLRSTSWRITAPLRVARRTFDALMRRLKAP